MKKFLVLGSLILVTVLLAACRGSSTQDPIQPGDKLGDFTITTGTEGKFTYGFEVKCSQPTEYNSYTCGAAVGEAINVSTGLYDSTRSGKLAEVWSHSNYQMFINDRPVDLKAFGTIDYDHPQVGTIRFANVVILAAQPGQITVRDSGVFDNGDPFSSTSSYVFTQP